MKIYVNLKISLYKTQAAVLTPSAKFWAAQKESGRKFGLLFNVIMRLNIELIREHGSPI